MKNTCNKSILIHAYVFFVLTIFSFTVQKYYSNHAVMRYRLFSTATITTALLLFICRKHYKPLFISMKIGMSDIFGLLFWISCLISTLLSPYTYEAVWGNWGNHMGFFMLTICMAAYFCVSRAFDFQKWQIECFMISAVIICILGIGHYMGYDLLGLKKYLNKEQQAIFVSTIGNINLYTAYVSIFSGITTTLFCLKKVSWSSLWHFFCMELSFVALITGISDNAYLSLMVLIVSNIGFMLYNSQSIGKIMVLLSGFFLSMQCVIWISCLKKDSVMNINSLFNILINKINVGAFGLLFAGLALLCYIHRKMQKRKKEITRVLFWSYFVILVILFIIAICFIIGINLNHNKKIEVGILPYFVFNEKWGTFRGWAWLTALNIFESSPLLRKVFGYGPESYGILLYKDYYYEMAQTTGEKFISAHNEYLQYLVTIGLSGLASYIGFIVFSWIDILKRGKKNPYAIAIIIGTMCYCAQAVVSFSNPVITPVFFVLLSIRIRDNTKQEF